MLNMLKVLRSDLQIHSPRDNNYKGWDFQKRGLEEWCVELIKLCQSKGVRVISITDHHDLTAAEMLNRIIRETGLENEIWLYPGLEITLKSKLQLMLYFQADRLPDKERVSGAIGVEAGSIPPVDEQPVLEDVKPVDREPDDLYKHLRTSLGDNYPFLLLPVVSSGSKRKEGIPKHDMSRVLIPLPWVFGGVFSGKGDWNKAILSGKDPQWGKKKVTVLRTSDQRGDLTRGTKSAGAFHPSFGKEPLVTYLKLSEPTIESLRQALISGEGNRVFYEEPVSPKTYIKAFTIEGSNKLCGGINDKGKREELATFEFSPGLNCLIGGRGTGKSITLSALARGLGIDSQWEPTPDEQDPITRHFSLFNKGGVFDPDNIQITVYIIKNDVPLKIEYTYEDGERKWGIFKRDPSGTDWVLIDEDYKPFLEELPLPFFTLQNQLSSLADLEKSREKLKTLITNPLSKEREEIKTKISELRSRYRELTENIARYDEAEKKRKEYKTREDLKNEELKQFRSDAETEFKEEDFALLENQQMLYDTVAYLDELPESVNTNLREMEDSADAVIAYFKDVAEELNKVVESEYSNPHLRSILEGITTLSVEATRHLNQARDLVNEYPSSVERDIEKAKELLEKKIGEAKAIEGKSKKSKEAKAGLRRVLKEIRETEKNIKQLDSGITRLRKGIKKAGAPEKLYDEIIGLVEKDTELLKKSAEGINTDPSIRLKIKITPAGESRSFVEEFLAPAAADYACHIKKRGWENLIEHADSCDNPADLWVKLMNELQQGDRKKAITWEKTGVFSSTTLNNIMAQIPQGTRDRISAEQVEDRIELLYRTKEGVDIPFNQASAGEQAVELLRLSLKESEGPVIIDQPESDLDNDYIVSDFIDELRLVRTRHQIVFATHNANIVVQGDADGIHVMDTDVAKGEEKEWCLVIDAGTIDQKDVKEQIETVLEGGRTAFLEREAKYLGEIHS